MLHQFIASLPFPAAVLDNNGAVIVISAGFARLVNIEGPDVTGENFFALCKPFIPPSTPDGLNQSSSFRLPKLPHPGEVWEAPCVWRGYVGIPVILDVRIAACEPGVVPFVGGRYTDRSIEGDGAGLGDVVPGYFVTASAVVAGEEVSPDGRTVHQLKLESLGVLASSVAHDLNNLLTSVLGHVSYLKLALGDVGAHRDSFVAIEDGARKGASLTQKILNFSKGHTSIPCAVDVSSVVSGAVNLLSAALPGGITLAVSEMDEQLLVDGDEDQLGQVVMNLIVNARDALPEGGNITVSLSWGAIAADEAERAGVQAGMYARLSIQDTGTGIPRHLRERIFEPFFTTKGHRGTGLGLAIVRSIVRSHGGAIALVSEEGRGTRFDVVLPLAQSQDFPLNGKEGARDLSPEEGDYDTGHYSDSESDNVEPARGIERILMVDDEEAVRTVVERSLEHLGYRVVCVATGAEAVRVFTSDPEGFDLVVIDMIMPQMSGDELFGHLVSIRPDVPVLVASGYSSDARTRRILDNGGLGFIQKPFAIEELASEVRRCIDKHQANYGQET